MPDDDHKLHWFRVPMRWTIKGNAMLLALSAEDAIAHCEGLGCEVQHDTGEIVDWEVTGKPEMED